MTGTFDGRFELDLMGKFALVTFTVNDISPSDPLPLNVAERMRDHMWSNLRDTVSNTTTLDRIVIGTQIDGAVLAVDETGTGAGTAVSAQVAALVTKNTGGRAGRLFWPGIPESNVDANGELASTLALQSAFDDVHADLQSNDLQMVVRLSTGGAPAGIAIVNSFTVNTITGTIRGRVRN